MTFDDRNKYRITSIKGARRGSISKRGALNRIKSFIIQSAYKVGDIRSLTCFSRSRTRFFVANSYDFMWTKFPYEIIHV
jgi:hypothetical protein